MRVWRKTAIVQRGGSERLRVSLAAAAHGFELKGKHLIHVPVGDLESALSDEPDAIVVGSIGFVRRGLAIRGVDVPVFEDYPPSLTAFLGRELRLTTLGEALDRTDGPWFVKPAEFTKLFNGFVADSVRSTFEASGLPPETRVWISSVVRFVSEWRCYVVEREIVKAGHYRGDPLVFPNAARVRSMLAAMVAAGEAPVSFVIDAGVTDRGETLLVEANDGYAVGNYALAPIEYAHLLETRWDEMVAPSQAIS